MIREDAQIQSWVNATSRRQHRYRFGYGLPPTVDDIAAFTRRSWSGWKGETLVPVDADECQIAPPVPMRSTAHTVNKRIDSEQRVRAKTAKKEQDKQAAKERLRAYRARYLQEREQEQERTFAKIIESNRQREIYLQHCKFAAVEAVASIVANLADKLPDREDLISRAERIIDKLYDDGRLSTGTWSYMQSADIVEAVDAMLERRRIALALYNTAHPTA